ncbi:amidohydrolase [Fulvivirgaceae bacterium BMA10]|uniref:Amidohydrolase n=1 Tax=Splendidivirga corallicola TaxID=3051826 RepID=A0ABT8KXQ8_9BACT|nr:amidohydrolase [Fulvivirgaceae bacterium BMA10]
MKRAFQSLLYVGVILIMTGSSSETSVMTRLDNVIKAEVDDLSELYFDLHRHPELSLFEKETSKKMAGELREIGFEVTENFGGYGVVGVYKNGDGPVILYRTDMDALPMQEKTGLPYASKSIAKDADGIEVNTMHSCGHDMHMTVWNGTARALVKMKDQWKGTLVFIGQPAEEIGRGAKLMLDAGLYEKFPLPDYGIGLHCSPTIEAGKVGYGSGFTMANTESVDIIVYGQGSHGATPHQSIDPIVLASLIVMDLQTIVSRTIPPTESAVLTVGSIKGGTKHNIIPDEVRLQLTLRSYKEEVRQMLHKGIERITKGAAIAAGLPENKYPKVVFPEIWTPANYNDPQLTNDLTASARKALGETNVLDAAPLMVGEDFSRYGLTEEDVPTVLFWLGTVPRQRIEQAAKNEEKLPGLHSPFYYPDVELTITTGVKVMSTSILDLMEKGRQ